MRGKRVVDDDLIVVLWIDLDLWGVCGGTTAAHVGSLGNLKFNMLHTAQ